MTKKHKRKHRDQASGADKVLARTHIRRPIGLAVVLLILSIILPTSYFCARRIYKAAFTVAVLPGRSAVLSLAHSQNSSVSPICGCLEDAVPYRGVMFSAHRANIRRPATSQYPLTSFIVTAPQPGKATWKPAFPFSVDLYSLDTHGAVPDSFDFTEVEVTNLVKRRSLSDIHFLGLISDDGLSVRLPPANPIGAVLPVGGSQLTVLLDASVFADVPPRIQMTDAYNEFPKNRFMTTFWYPARTGGPIPITNDPIEYMDLPIFDFLGPRLVIVIDRAATIVTENEKITPSPSDQVLVLVVNVPFSMRVGVSPYSVDEIHKNDVLHANAGVFTVPFAARDQGSCSIELYRLPSDQEYSELCDRISKSDIIKVALPVGSKTRGITSVHANLPPALRAEYDQHMRIAGTMSAEAELEWSRSFRERVQPFITEVGEGPSPLILEDKRKGFLFRFMSEERRTLQEEIEAHSAEIPGEEFRYPPLSRGGPLRVLGDVSAMEFPKAMGKVRVGATQKDLDPPADIKIQPALPLLNQQVVLALGNHWGERREPIQLSGEGQLKVNGNIMGDFILDGAFVKTCVILATIIQGVAAIVMLLRSRQRG